MTEETIATEPAKALNCWRVRDLTGRMGGYCGQLLANLGAEVILIEPPAGDPMRRQGPFRDNVHNFEGSISFAGYHANKRGIVLDLESDEGRRPLRELAANTAVLL